MVIKAFLNSNGSHNALCPVRCLFEYVSATNKFRTTSLFVNPVNGTSCNKGHIVYYFRKLIELAQPGVYARFHDLRKLSSWKAFWSRMSISSIKHRGFWRSNNALYRRYLGGSVPLNTPCVAMGEVCLWVSAYVWGKIRHSVFNDNDYYIIGKILWSVCGLVCILPTMIGKWSGLSWNKTNLPPF